MNVDEPSITAEGADDHLVEQEEVPPTEGRTVPAGALVVAIMVAAALAILAVVALSVGDGGADRDLADARLAAGRFGERFLTFEHDGLDQWKSGVLSLSTGGFSKEVDEVEDGLRRLIGEAELDATTQVTEIFMGEIDRGTVSAVLLYDRDLRSASGTRSESDRYLQLTLLQVDGEWLVDNVIDIATADALAPSPATTTSTPVTPSPSTDPAG